MVHLTEDQIEIAVEHKVDRLDAIFMAHKITQEQYDEEMEAIHAWATKEYRFLKREGQ